MNRLKVLIIYPIDSANGKLGGPETAIRTYIECAPQDLDFEIVGIIKKGSLLKIGKWHDVIFNGKQVRFLPILNVKDYNIRTLIPLALRFTLALVRWRHRISFKWRVIVFHRIEPSYVLRGIKKKKVLFVHGDIRDYMSRCYENRWRKFSRIYFLLEPFFMKQMKKVFVVSQEGCKYYQNRYSNYFNRFQFLPTWYMPQVFRRIENIKKDEILRSYGIPDAKPLILFVGRLEMQKDPFLLVESFAIINKSYSYSQLVIVGEGRLEGQIRRRVKSLNLSGKVIFVGRRLASEIAEVMNISDLLLLTSGFEGMPRVVLESLACGLPVVITDVGEVRLLVKDRISGKVVSTRNPQDIAKAAVDIISSPPSVYSCQNAVSSYSQESILPAFYSEFRKMKDE